MSLDGDTVPVQTHSHTINHITVEPKRTKEKSRFQAIFFKMNPIIRDGAMEKWLYGK